MSRRTKLALLFWVMFIALGAWRALYVLGERASMEHKKMEGERIAASAADDLVSNLKGQLEQGLKDLGPQGAFELCGAVAQSETTRLAEKYGFQMRRTALNVRNPANAPGVFEGGWMKRAAKGSTVEAPIAPYTKVTRDSLYRRELHYMKPLYVGASCLVCHGSAEQIPDEVESLLDDLYPTDQARGYSLGEFRGVVSVKMLLDV
ncbi:MAG: DUF3365 domain-containing protein [Planctomycetes bacterium]|nr:DUF3365 domain-containing protein [Planctomycetota bacterium]